MNGIDLDAIQSSQQPVVINIRHPTAEEGLAVKADPSGPRVLRRRPVRIGRFKINLGVAPTSIRLIWGISIQNNTRGL